jgi:uncharacterized protein YecE (DUF72 family)
MYCGTSNIVLPVRNKSFYPPEFASLSRLSYYSSLFNSLEVNQTFYKLPKAATIARWVQETPDEFRFTMKLGKEITHNKGLAFDHNAVDRYLEVFEAAGTKKGCLLIQLPGGTNLDAFNQLTLLLELINEQNNGWKLAVEFRNTTWYIGEVYELLVSQNAVLVEHGMPKSTTPAELPQADARYFRFHGILGDYRGTYDMNLLKEYLLKIKDAEANGQEVYAYFNNTMGEAVHNAASLIDLYKTR